MRLNRAKAGGALDPASIRLPIVALIDVVLFLLMYFMVAGTLGADEDRLATALKPGGPGRTTSTLAPQVVSIEMRAGQPVFSVGARVMADRDELVRTLSALPKEAGVAVKAAPDVPIAATAAAIQSCRDAGFERVGYLTPPRTNPAPSGG